MFFDIAKGGRKIKMIWLKACPRCKADIYLKYALGETTIICPKCRIVITSLPIQKTRKSLAGRVFKN